MAALLTYFADEATAELQQCNRGSERRKALPQVTKVLSGAGTWTQALSAIPRALG